LEQLTCPGCSHEVATDKTAGRSGNQEVKCPSCRDSFPLALWRMDTPDVDLAEDEPEADQNPEAVAPPQPQPPQRQGGVWTCPYCGSHAGYDYRSEITTAGWIFAIVLMLFLCLPLFWIGLCIRRKVPYCRTCFMDLQ